MEDGVTNPDKASFVKAYFEQVKLRIERLAQLRSEKVGGVSFKDEAFILCLVYIDSLASCYYGEANGRTFCKVLRELSGSRRCQFKRENGSGTRTISRLETNMILRFQLRLLGLDNMFSGLCVSSIQSRSS